MADSAYITAQGDTVDFICWRFYDRQSGAVEAVLAANAGLADLGAVIPINTRIILPELAVPVIAPPTVSLWD